MEWVARLMFGLVVACKFICSVSDWLRIFGLCFEHSKIVVSQCAFLVVDLGVSNMSFRFVGEAS